MAQKSYPQQIGTYVVKTKSEQSTHSWQDFDMARLQISVGQDYHEGEKMQATADWCAPRFKKVMVCVNDSLQRFNIMFEYGLSEQEAYIKSQQDGQFWVDGNLHKFSGISNLELKRWDSWLAEPEFDNVLKKIQTLYVSNREFREAIDQNIESIWERRRIMNSNKYRDSRRDEFEALSRRYLLEEIAVFSLMFQHNEGIDIYPGTAIFAALVFQERETEGAPKGLGKGRFCRIDFSHNKSHLRVIT